MKSGHKRNKSSGSQSSFEQKMEASNNAAPEGNPLLERAFQGKITPDEYRTVVRNYIRDENKKTTGLGLVSISTHSIDFNAELSNSLLPVLDFEEKSKFSARAVIKLTNASKQKVFFDISWFNNPKFALEVTPTSAEIKANSSIEATLDIRVFCTTKVYQMLDIHLTKTKKKGILGKKTEEDIGHLFLMIKLQSEASSSIDYDEIKKEELIGEGAYGKVFRGFYREDEVAIKELNLEQYVDEELVLVRREIGNMSKLKSKFIVQYIGATLVRSQPLCVVMEYIKNGTLTKFLETRPFSNAFKTKLSLDVARGMAVLHSNNVGHRDLKSDNVLVFTHNEDAPLNLKITDFGQSKAQVNREKESNYANYETFNVAAKKQEIRSSKGVGTLIYQAPEILEGSSTFNDQSIDVFSFGVLLWQIFTQREPYSMEPYTNWNGRQIADFVKSGNRLAIPKETPREITALITACWDQDPSNRPQFSQTIVPSLTQIYEKLAKEGSNGPLPQLPLGVSSTASTFLPHQQPIGLVQNNSFTSSSAYPFNGMNSGSSKGSSGSTSPNQGVAPYIPIVGGAPEPPGNLYAIGWCGEIARDDAVKLLQKYPKGCFLVRWSSKQKCFVVSYNAPSSGVKHIDSIWLKDNQIQVLRADNSMPVYKTMEEYISTLREQEKILGEPIKIQLPQTNDDNIYDKA